MMCFAFFEDQFILEDLLFGASTLGQFAPVHLDGGHADVVGGLDLEGQFAHGDEHSLLDRCVEGRRGGIVDGALGDLGAGDEVEIVVRAVCIDGL